MCVELGCKVAHLALAWVAKKPYTSTVILGASRPEQVVDNLKALEVIPKLTPEIEAEIESILANKPEPEVRCVEVFFLCPCCLPDEMRCMILTFCFFLQVDVRTPAAGSAFEVAVLE